MLVSAVVDALGKQNHPRDRLERLVAGFHVARTGEAYFEPGTPLSLWGVRDDACNEVRGRNEGERVLRAMLEHLPTDPAVLKNLLYFVADRGDGSYEPERSSALTPVSVTHAVELVERYGVESARDVISWLWVGDEAAFARLKQVAPARFASFTGTDPGRWAGGGVSREGGEARVFALLAAPFPDEGAAIRYVASSTSSAAGQRGLCSAAATWLAGGHGLTLPAAPTLNGWDGGVSEKGIAVGRLLAAVDQALPDVLAEVGVPLLESIWYGKAIGLAARLFGRWDAGFVVDDGSSFFEAAARRGLLYTRSGKSGKDGRAAFKGMDAKKAIAEVEKKTAAKAKAMGAPRAPL